MSPTKQSKAGLDYITSIGFRNPVQLPTKNPPRVALGFSYKDFDPERVRASIGKPKLHSADGVFVFRVAPDRAIRVNTKKKTILLVSGRAKVVRLMEIVRNA